MQIELSITNRDLIEEFCALQRKQNPEYRVPITQIANHMLWSEIVRQVADLKKKPK